MNSSARTPPSQSAPSQPAQPEPDREPTDAAWWSWSGVGVPIILRVPRGVAVAIAGGLLALLVLSYWVGYSRGWSAAEVQAQQQQAGNPDALRGRQAPTPRTGGSSDAGNRGAASNGAGRGSQAGGTSASAGRIELDGPAPGPHRAGSTGDPREAGFNYFVLATYTPEAARRLAEFITRRGVETVLEPVHNRGLVRVWAVNRGFPPDELGSAAYQAFEDRLQKIGRAWKDHNDDFGDALESMHPDKYEGE